MKLLLTPHHTLDVHASRIILREACPIVNGALLKITNTQVLQDEADLKRVCYWAEAIAPGFFTLETRLSSDGQIRINYWLEDLPKDFLLDSFGIQFQAVENLRAYLRNGYTSWDGSYYVHPEAMSDRTPVEGQPETGFAMTQILPRQGNDGYLVLGFERHDRFQHSFTFDTHRPPKLSILSLWDRKNQQDQECCSSECLLVLEHNQVEEGLREWARLCAKGSVVPPRLPERPITGWCSWYNLYGYINEENILEHLRSTAEVVQREKLPLEIFQIDDGFTPEMGDWLDVKPQFPRGMQPLLEDIRRAGFKPGLWIAPFMVGNRSKLYRQHPDWVVQDAQAGGPLVQWRLYGEFRWHKRSEEYYILDATHPAAFEYLSEVFRTWRWNWGCEYFKTDFMFFGSQHGPDRAAWHVPGSTRIEVWRKVAEMIRQQIGDAVWLGCGCPLWASIGLVDGIRIGRDVGVDWRGNLSAQSLLRDQATRNFTNHILWQADPDCVLLRERYHHLTTDELEALAIYAGMSGGVLTTSDDLSALSVRRLDLLRLILPVKNTTCNFPYLGQSELFYEHIASGPNKSDAHLEPRPADPVLVQVRLGSATQDEHSFPSAAIQTAALFIFNTSEDTIQRTYWLASLGLGQRQYVIDWRTASASPDPVESLVVTLPAHHGALFFTSDSAWLQAPTHLPG